MMSDPLGEHYLIELYECQNDALDNVQLVSETMLEAARLAGATIIDERFHKFSPQGVSGVIVIAESHLSIHTWPELGYAALDLFTCSHDLDMQQAMDLLKRVFSPGDVQVRYVPRGIVDPAFRKSAMQIRDVSLVYSDASK
jgi:S-adenosylmethionine decarboxylase proenzyme